MLADDGPAGVAGVKQGDTIVSINGDHITNFAAFKTKIFTNPNKEFRICCAAG